MKKCYRVIHQSGANDAFALNEKQIQHEYNSFNSVLAKFLEKPTITRDSKRSKCSTDGVWLTLEGAVLEADLDAEAHRLLKAMNTEKVANRIGQPNFVVAETKVK